MLTGLGKWSVLKPAVNYSVRTSNAAAGKKYTQYPSRSASIFLGQLSSWRKSKSFFDLTNLFSIYCNSWNISFSASSMMLLIHSSRTLRYQKGLICFFPPQPTSPNPFYMLLPMRPFPSLNSPLLTRLQCIAAGVIWSVRVMRVIWSAMDVKVNIAPLLCSGKCMSETTARWGIPHTL